MLHSLDTAKVARARSFIIALALAPVCVAHRHRAWTWLTAVSLLLALAQTAAAQQPARDAYVGVGIGQFSYEIRSDGIRFLDTAVGAIKLYGGFRLSRHWAFEGSYQITATETQQGLPDSVEAALSGAGLPLGVGATTSIRLEIATMRLTRRFPLDWGQLFAGIGASGASVDTELKLAGGLPLAAGFHTAKNGLTLDAGAQWEFSSWSLRLEYEWWDADMHAAGLSIHWHL